MPSDLTEAPDQSIITYSREGSSQLLIIFALAATAIALTDRTGLLAYDQPHLLTGIVSLLGSLITDQIHAHVTVTRPSQVVRTLCQRYISTQQSTAIILQQLEVFSNMQLCWHS